MLSYKTRSRNDSIPRAAVAASAARGRSLPRSLRAHARSYTLSSLRDSKNVCKNNVARIQALPMGYWTDYPGLFMNGGRREPSVMSKERSVSEETRCLNLSYVSRLL